MLNEWMMYSKAFREVIRQIKEGEERAKRGSYDSWCRYQLNRRHLDSVALDLHGMFSYHGGLNKLLEVALSHGRNDDGRDSKFRWTRLRCPTWEKHYPYTNSGMMFSLEEEEVDDLILAEDINTSDPYEGRPYTPFLPSAATLASGEYEEEDLMTRVEHLEEVHEDQNPKISGR